MLPSFFHSEHSGRPHIEINSLGYHYVVDERGEEFKRFTTENFRELLFWIFKSVSFEMASKWEVENRKENEDSRRQLFQKQIEIIKEVDEEFALRLSAEKELILKRSPFND